MKSLLVSLLLFAFAQGAHAALLPLNEGQSKKIYTILAGYGLRDPRPAQMETLEWAKPAVCLREVNGGIHYTCQVHDNFHNTNVQRTGMLAKKLYDFIKGVNGANCEGNRCLTTTKEIQCTHYWPNKDNPPPRHYFCQIDKISAGMNEN